MQLDLTSFVLELINFAVLVWILHRFLYKPVLAAIDRRRAAVESSLAQAKTARDEAAALKTQVEERLASWERERAEAKSKLAAELAAQRDKALAQTARAAEQERARLAALQARQELERRGADEQRALEQAAGFAGRLLERVAGPELDARLVELLAADLGALARDRLESLAEAVRAAGGSVAVQSARPQQALSQSLGVEGRAQYAVDESLLGGVRVALGSWLLQADLADELRFFSGGARGAR